MPRDLANIYPNQENMRRNNIMTRSYVQMQKIRRNDSNIENKSNKRSQYIDNAKKQQQQDIENQLPLKNLTKKIQKVANSLTSRKNNKKQSQITPRKPFRDVTNLQNQSDSSSEKTPKVSASYLEDNALTESLNSGSTTVKKTYHHAVLSYANVNTQKVYQFSCFLDNELNIPEKYVMKTIEHSIDNDVDTDDDQIASAIRSVSRQIEEAYKSNKLEQERQQKLQQQNSTGSKSSKSSI